MIDLNLNPDRRTLRQFGGIALAGFGLVAAIIWWKNGLFGVDFGGAGRPVALALLGLGIASALFGIVFPSANRPIYVGLALLTFPIGFVVSHIVLAVIFFGLLTPLGLVFRLLGRDALHRRFDREATSYWAPHSSHTDLKRYFRQF